MKKTLTSRSQSLHDHILSSSSRTDYYARPPPLNADASNHRCLFWWKQFGTVCEYTVFGI
jgi:hypothetical protein